MKKTYKIGAIVINVVFSISCIYFMLFYSNGILGRPLIKIEALEGVIGFLFFKESVIIPVMIFGCCLIAVAILAWFLYRKIFSMATIIMLCLGFVPALIPILCNAYFGPSIDADGITGAIKYSITTAILLIYIVVFKIFFYRDYKRMD